VRDDSSGVFDGPSASDHDCGLRRSPPWRPTTVLARDRRHGDAV